MKRLPLSCHPSMALLRWGNIMPMLIDWTCRRTCPLLFAAQYNTIQLIIQAVASPFYVNRWIVLRFFCCLHAFTSFWQQARALSATATWSDAPELQKKTALGITPRLISVMANVALLAWWQKVLFRPKHLHYWNAYECIINSHWNRLL
jgi:hypothetical protein